MVTPSLNRVRTRQSKWIRAAAVLAMGMFWPVCTEAATHTVKDVGAFDAAAALAEPGDTLVLADGTWRDAVLEFRATGTADRPIVLRSATPGGTILTGSSRLTISGQHLVVSGLWFKDGALADRGSVISFRGEDTRHCRLTQTAITDYNPEDTQIRYSWINLSGTRNRIDHCYLQGKTNGSVDVGVSVGDTPNEHRIDHNRFAGRPPLGRNGGETIRVGNSRTSMRDSRTVVERNWFENCDGEAEIISSKSCENVYRENVFWMSSGSLTLRHGNRCLVTNNWFFGKGKEGSGGVRVIGEDHTVTRNYFEGLMGTNFRAALVIMNAIPNPELNEYWQVKRAKVSQNLFVDCVSTVDINVGFGSRNRVVPPVDTRIAQNVFSNERDTLVTIRDDASGISWEGNLFHGVIGIDLPEANDQGDPELVEKQDGSKTAGKMPAVGPGVPMIDRSDTGPDWIAVIEASAGE